MSADITFEDANGQPFLIPSTGAGLLAITKQVFEGEYDAPELPAQVETILDIGACIGAFAVWAHRKWPAAHIQCYEPNVQAVTYCKRNAPFAMMYEVAVTTDEAPTLFLHEDWGMNYTRLVDDPFVEHWRASQAHTIVDVISTHPRNLPPCDLLKIDAEGVEPEILLHYKYLGGVKICMYEYHSVTHRDACRATCKLAGLMHVKHMLYNEVQGTDVWVRPLEATKGETTMTVPSDENEKPAPSDRLHGWPTQWEIVKHEDTAYLARVFSKSSGHMIDRSPSHLILCPAYEYIYKLGFKPMDPKTGKEPIFVNRQVVPIDFMGSVCEVILPLNAVARRPLKSYDPEDQATFLKMLKGAIEMQDMAIAKRKESHDGPRIETNIPAGLGDALRRKH